ncbi:MAG: protein kinase [Deltaproteobacteria bacterium]|nr:protein kinase [Deltaproteobacteria bacterium]
MRPGELVRGRYEVDEPLGVGRLGAVVSAIDTDTDVQVALKVIHPSLVPDDRSGSAFLKGMRSLIKSAHPYMNRVLDVNCEGDKYFVVFAHLDGIPLRRLMESRRAQGQYFTLDEFFPIAKQVAQFFAESDVDVHGSISPENLWIQPQHIKLLDVGLAANLPVAAVAYRLSSNNLVRGYVAPEVLRGRTPDARSDVFSMGVLLGEMLTQARYDGRPEMFQQVDPDLPQDIDAILRRALLSDPRGRHFDTTELLETIAEIAGLPVPNFAKSDASTPAAEAAGGRSAAAVPADEPSQPSAPLSAADFGLQHVPDSTVQVSMADVIRAHVDGTGPGLKDAPVPLIRPSEPPPPHRSSTTPPPTERFASEPPPPVSAAAPRPAARQVAPLPTARRPSTPPPAARRPGVQPPARRSTVPPPARRSSVPPPARRSSVPPPPAPASHKPPMVQAPPASTPPSFPIEPRRPSPLARDTVPPPPLERLAPPPTAERVDSLPIAADDEDTAVRRYVTQRREVTQEIELDQVETVEEIQPRREVTQEVDMGMIESVEHSSMKDAVDKLVAQASAAEDATAEDLLRHAEKLDGVDPRFVRAAHSLEADRRGASSRRAAEMLQEKATKLDGIDPRFLRAAARLEEAKIHDTSSVVKVEEVQGKEKEEKGEEWRERMEANAEDSVISFLAPPVVERSPEVKGFPRSVQRRPQPRPPADPPRAPAPPPRAGNRRAPQKQKSRALYDDSGETDDESQPTIRVAQSSIATAAGRVLPAGLLRGLEVGLILVAGLLLVAMATLVALAVAQR